MSTEPFVPIEDLAKHFTVSVSTVRAWVRQDLIPKHTYVKVGNTYRFCVSKVVEALTAPAAAPEPVQETPTEAPAEDDTPVQLELDFNNPDEDA
jgi:DNA-binding transcriptional MerR regulator